MLARGLAELELADEGGDPAAGELVVGQRPAVNTCILLADHFEVNPNEFLELAGHPPLKVFEVKTPNAQRLPPEAVEVALDIARIPNPGTRKAVAAAIRTLLQRYFED